MSIMLIHVNKLGGNNWQIIAWITKQWFLSTQNGCAVTDPTSICLLYV